jgi:hypothetical protein
MLGICAFPEEKVGEALFAAGADEQVDFGWCAVGNWVMCVAKDSGDLGSAGLSWEAAIGAARVMASREE